MICVVILIRVAQILLFWYVHVKCISSLFFLNIFKWKIQVKMHWVRMRRCLLSTKSNCRLEVLIFLVHLYFLLFFLFDVNQVGYLISEYNNMALALTYIFVIIVIFLRKYNPVVNNFAIIVLQINLNFAVIAQNIQGPVYVLLNQKSCNSVICEYFY